MKSIYILPWSFVSFKAFQTVHEKLFFCLSLLSILLSIFGVTQLMFAASLCCISANRLFICILLIQKELPKSVQSFFLRNIWSYLRRRRDHYFDSCGVTAHDQEDRESETGVGKKSVCVCVCV